ncbi:MAG: SMP-30/gluconolactonase/LRE family protein, partial [Verrucomicrobia bacterium]|nr:SMP-30/gluconolactonase/LRE family protein [Verrucomicrobiota bacterium]
RLLIAHLAFAFTLSAQASDIVARNGELTQIADGFKFTEGGARDVEGNIFFTDVRNNKIHKWNFKTNKVTIFKDDSRGANGCWIDSNGNLIVCEHGGRGIYQINKDGSRKTIVNEYEGKKLNSPNDLWMDKRGGIYFSDPRYGQNRDDMEQEGEHVYYLSPNRKKLTRVTDDLVRPNGLLGSLDGKTLYIADQGDGKTFAYDIKPDGTLKNKRLFIEEGSDGVTIDHKGNIYITNTAVRVFSPDGSFIEEIVIPKRPSNVCFGGDEGKTLFITAREAVYSLQMKVRGASVN